MYSSIVVNKVLEQARSGKTMREISDDTGVHYWTVFKWLRIRGVKAARGKPGGPNGLKRPPKFYISIAERVKTETLQHVADEYGVTRERVRQWAKFAGFKKSEFLKGR